MSRFPRILLFTSLLAGCAKPPVTAEPLHLEARPLPDVRVLVDQIAARHGIPTYMAHRVVRVESSYRCNVRNADAVGIMQVKPATARSVGVAGDLTNCRTGLEAGMRYLRLALDRGGHGCEGISLYNTGIYARPRCTPYGRKVLGGAP